MNVLVSYDSRREDGLLAQRLLAVGGFLVCFNGSKGAAESARR